MKVDRTEETVEISTFPTIKPVLMDGKVYKVILNPSLRYLWGAYGKIVKSLSCAESKELQFSYSPFYSFGHT